MSYSKELTKTEINSIIEKFKAYELPPTNNYTLFRAKYKGCTITIFQTNKILLQGSSDDTVLKEIIPDLVVKEKTVNSRRSITLSLIGTDEVGFGDFFGGVVVAGAYVPFEFTTQLIRLGVKDSKLLTDEKIIEIAPILMEKIKHSVLLLDPLKLNYVSTVLNYNFNKVKSLLHNSVIRNLKKKIDNYDGIIIDGFTTRSKYFEYLDGEKEIEFDVDLEEKAENKYISVAAASIIARYVFLKHIEELSKNIGFELPLGAGSKIDLAIVKILKNKNIKYFNQIAKTFFKNFDKYKI